MRVPWPAAMTMTTGARVTRRMVVGHNQASRGEWCNGSTAAFGAVSGPGSNPGSPAAVHRCSWFEAGQHVRTACEHVFVPRIGPRYTEEEATKAIAESMSWAEALRNLGMCPSGGAGAILRKYARIWGISTAHFDPYARHRGTRTPLRSMADVLVENSTYSRGNLKARLFREGYKSRCCELCGQGEDWHGRKMSLILDHI